MAELGSDSGSDYPGSLDSDASLEVNAPAAGKTKARAAVVNDLASAIVAIETELGTDPAGSQATLKARLSTSLEDDGSPKDTVVVTVSGSNQTITGSKVFESGITTSGIVFGVDNLHDIGESGALRPRDVYIAGEYKSGTVGFGRLSRDEYSQDVSSVTIGLNYGNVISSSTFSVSAGDRVFVSASIELTQGTSGGFMGVRLDVDGTNAVFLNNAQYIYEETETSIGSGTGPFKKTITGIAKILNDHGNFAVTLSAKTGGPADGSADGQLYFLILKD